MVIVGMQILWTKLYIIIKIHDLRCEIWVMWSRKLPGWTNQKHAGGPKGDGHFLIWFLGFLNSAGGTNQEEEQLKLWKEVTIDYSGLYDPVIFLEEVIKK